MAENLSEQEYRKEMARFDTIEFNVEELFQAMEQAKRESSQQIPYVDKPSSTQD